ncbi:MAG: peptidylprolyl isomerase [Phenylobacterium sp.]|uniref:peptidylprolyl isomerase n=1 Tax=Phenylobacterium sp. TaxID=1871053 RepID=UPI0025E6C1FC|nr:peptidylprolyl isomerase [Phenylobacterium sp.]MBI1197934.1 peptidylprolyl isomerase [Phenylobacterium sp.]
MSARAIVIDGVEIPETLLAQEVQNHPGASAAEARHAAGHALAIRALLLNRALELGLDAQPERDEQGREETPEEALVRAVLDHEVEIAPPTQAECLRVYAANPARFRAPALKEAAHILIEPADATSAADAAARERAERAIAALQAGVCTFAELARDLSDCPSAEVGGSLGQLRPGDLVPEVEDVLDALQPGDIAIDPVRSRFGWHVLKLARRIDGQDLPFEFVEDRIRLGLEARAWTAAATRYVADLAADARSRGVALSLTADGGVRDGSATLGDFLGDGQAGERLLSWLQATDADLARRLSEAADAVGDAPADFARQAMAAFVAEADDERWTNLISAARDAADPAVACLAAVLRSKLVPAKQTFTVIRRVAS